MKIQLLNHAAVVMEFGEVKLLTDPWYFGNCFEGGWGLRFDNPNALQLSEDSTHLWISHFHGDHFHMPTLKKLYDVNPDIRILGNHSYNFKLDNAIKRVGFKNVLPLNEREWMMLSDQVKVIRYPATGIDNMLLIHYNEIQILNYNDCNLPKRARKRISKKLGRVDILLNNYNHAGKLLEFHLPTPEQVKADWKQNFVESSDSFHPKYIIPFASHHYYRAKESQELNLSLMSTDELVGLDERVIPFQIGETLVFDENLDFERIPSEGPITSNEPEIAERTSTYTLEQLKEEFAGYAKNMRKAFLYVTFWLPNLLILIEDLDMVVSLNLSHGLKEYKGNRENYHIVSSSEALHKWFSTMYGTDNFSVGAHFDINKANVLPLRWQFLIGLLTENKLDPRAMIRMLFSAEGRRFLYNRREEISAILMSKAINVGLRK